MFRARAVRYACLLCHLVKIVDAMITIWVSKLGGIKPHLQPLDLQGELIILI